MTIRAIQKKNMAFCVAFLCWWILLFNTGACQTCVSDECHGEYKTVMLSSNHGVRGFDSFADTDIVTFLGIPYALPPIGDLRFSKPVPVSWTGVKDGLTLAPACLQSSDVTECESEDCLYLNVFTPNTDGSLPVMVWIHGGGFSIGSGMYWDDTQLASHNVVIVTINYRLGPLGFASTGDNVMPGNFGMLDQVLALKWVQENIGAFGGDANQVTLFGISAGGTSISLHLFSPMSVGLFHRAIMESGSSFSMWGVDRKKDFPTMKDATLDIATSLRCPDLNDSTLVLECLRHKTGHAIVKQANQLGEETNTLMIFKPRVETTFGFLPEYPEVCLKNGKFQNIEIMTGFTSGEAGEIIYNTFPDAKGISRAQFKHGLLQVFTWCSFDNELDIVDYFTDFYLKNVTDHRTILLKLYEAANDIFKMPILNELRKYLSHQTTPQQQRLFQFDYIPSSLDVPKYVGLPHWSQRDLVFYSTANTTIFVGDTYFALELSPEDVLMARKIQSMWTNFAKSGKPLGEGHEDEWPAYTLSTPLMAHINLELSMTPYIKQDEMEVYWGFIEFISSPQQQINYINSISLAVIGVALGLLYVLKLKRQYGKDRKTA